MSPLLFLNLIKFRKDSDVFMPYGPKANEHRRSLALERSAGLKSPLITTATQNKTKLVAWIVSNCKSNSGRERYAEEL